MQWLILNLQYFRFLVRRLLWTLQKFTKLQTIRKMTTLKNQLKLTMWGNKLNKLETNSWLYLQDQSSAVLTPMKSTKFFIIHVVFNTVLMFSVSSFLFTTATDLDSNSDDALVIPQLLGVVPGTIKWMKNEWRRMKNFKCKFIFI